LLRPGKRLRAGASIAIDDELRVSVATGEGPLREVRLVARRGGVAEAVERCGRVPLPPYIKRPDRPEDRERYQTVYARETGSVAAPTAGLHFTTAVLERLAERGIPRAEIVLHVGPGTFRPVDVEDVRDHRVEAEVYEIPSPTAERVQAAKERGHRVLAV